MSWLAILAIAVISDALRIFIDNYASDFYFKEKGAVSQKIISGLILPIAGLITLILNSFNPTAVEPSIVILLLLSGLLSSLAGIPYFKALEIDDSTNVGLFFQFSPILYLLFNWLFFGQSISIMQLIGSIIILGAPFSIIFTAQKRSRKLRIRAAIYAFISILFYVASGVLFVQTDTAVLGPFNEIGLVLIAKGLSDLIIIGSRKQWRHRLIKVVRSSHRRVLIPISASLTMRLIQEFTYRIGLIIAPTVAIASAASDSVEPIVIFFMGLLLTLIWPKFGREKLQKKVILVHLVATILVVIGIVLMRF